MSDDDTRLLVRNRGTDDVFWVDAADVEPIASGPTMTQWRGHDVQVHNDLHIRDLTSLPTIEGDWIGVGDRVTTNGTGSPALMLRFGGTAVVEGFSTSHGVIWVGLDHAGEHSWTSIPLSRVRKIG